jgi:hypothetical protein
MENIRTPAARPDGRSAATAPLSAVMASSARAAVRARDRGGATSPVTKDAPDFYALLEQIRAGAAAVRASTAELTKAAYKTLADILSLHGLRISDPAARRALEREYKRAGIRFSKKTTEVTRLVKWLLGEGRPRATVGRFADKPWLTHEEEVEPEDFVAFPRGKGGARPPRRAPRRTSEARRRNRSRGTCGARRRSGSREACCWRRRRPRHAAGQAGSERQLFHPGAAAGRGQRRPQVRPGRGGIHRRRAAQAPPSPGHICPPGPARLMVEAAQPGVGDHLDAPAGPAATCQSRG